MAGNFWLSSHCQRWLVEPAELERAARRDLAYLPAGTRLSSLHSHFVTVICALTRQLSLLKFLVSKHQQVVATAVTYFRRFYLNCPLTTIDPYLTALTCVYMAVKVEECGPLPVRHIVTAAQELKKREEEEREVSASQHVWHGLALSYTLKDVIEAEFYIAQELDYSLIVFHPYRSLLEYCVEAKVEKS